MYRINDGTELEECPHVRTVVRLTSSPMFSQSQKLWYALSEYACSLLLARCPVVDHGAMLTAAQTEIPANNRLRSLLTAPMQGLLAVGAQP
jgi:hypothetical protein